MPSTYMLSKGRVKIPKEVRQRLNLKEGDRIAFFYSEEEKWYRLIAQNKSATELMPLNRPKSTETVEEKSALFRFYRGRFLVSKEELDLVIGVLQRERLKMEQKEALHGPLNGVEEKSVETVVPTEETVVETSLRGGDPARSET
jgi:antitoxin PrlF